MGLKIAKGLLDVPEASRTRVVWYLRGSYDRVIANSIDEYIEHHERVGPFLLSGMVGPFPVSGMVCPRGPFLVRGMVPGLRLCMGSREFHQC